VQVPSHNAAMEMDWAIRAARLPIDGVWRTWRVAHFGALTALLAFTPSTYRGAHRRQLAAQLVDDTVPCLLRFPLMGAVVTALITQIVLAITGDYGLSRYALEMVIRVLVLELIPITSALYVALRCSVPNAAEVSRMRRKGVFSSMAAQGLDPMRLAILPRVMSAAFASITLAALAGVLASVVSYVWVHGFSFAGWESFAGTFGQVFTPVVTWLFVIKTLLSSWAVATIPMAYALYELPGAGSRTRAELGAVVRLFAVLVVIEVATLVGNYY
jgi:phospholipid/cholesterol/gamma-HCH transport system permease protein